MSYCNRCGAEVKWIKRARGWVPYEPQVDLVIHRCGKPKPGPGRPLIVSAGPPTGPAIPPCPNPCGRPPWEACACSFEGR